MSCTFPVYRCLRSVSGYNHVSGHGYSSGKGYGYYYGYGYFYGFGPNAEQREYPDATIVVEPPESNP